MDSWEYDVCITTEIGMFVNLLIYGSALTFIMIKHNKMLNCVTKVLLLVPLIEYILVLCYITPIMMDQADLPNWSCLYPTSSIIANTLFVS